MNVLYLLSLKGRHATQDELTASAFQAVNLDRMYNDEPVQVRVTMGKEPRHFMAIFKGKMVIFEVRPWLHFQSFNETQFDFRHQTKAQHCLSLFFLIRGAPLEKAPLNLHLQ